MVQKLHCYREQTKAEIMLKKNPCEKGVKECGGDGVEAAAAGGACPEHSRRCASTAESPPVVTPGEAPTVLGTLPQSPRCLTRAPFGSSHLAATWHNRSTKGQHQGTSCSHPLRAHTRRTQPFIHPTFSSPTASPPCSTAMPAGDLIPSASFPSSTDTSWCRERCKG